MVRFIRFKYGIGKTTSGTLHTEWKMAKERRKFANIQTKQQINFPSFYPFPKSFVFQSPFFYTFGTNYVCHQKSKFNLMFVSILT